MTNKADEALKETIIEKKKTSLKISKKDTSRKTKKVILEAPILEQFSPEKSVIKSNKPEQNAVGSFSDVKKSNTSLKPVTPRPNILKNAQKLDTDQILIKPKKTLKLSINTNENSDVEELPEETNFENTISTSKKDISINQNSSFFSEPSIFEKFNIEVSTESNESTLEDSDSKEFDFISDDLPKELEEKSEEKENNLEEEYDFVSTEMPDIYKTTYSLENNLISDNIPEIAEENIISLDSSNEISNNFFESSIPNTEDVSATSNSVFKEFAFEEETTQNSETEIVQNASPFAILNQENSNKPVIENLENINNNIEVSAEPNTLVLPSTNEAILNSQEILDVSGDILPNIITQINSSLDDDNLDLSDEEVDKELDEILGIETSEKENDAFSIEEYFGVTVNEQEKSEEDLEIIEDSAQEESEDVEIAKPEQPDVTSFSKLIEGFTQTISTLSNKISDLEANIAENENNKKMRTDAYIEDLLNSSVELDDINLDDISLDDINVEDLNSTVEEPEENQSVENILMKAFDNSKIDNQMKQDLLTEVLEVENSVEPVSPTPASSDITSDFFKVIDSLSKTISELEDNNEKEIENDKEENITEEPTKEIFEEPIVEDVIENQAQEILEEPVEESILPVSDPEEVVVPAPIVATPEVSSEKAINILINKDDIFSISIANETYEIVTDFDGISVLSENIHISTPKNNFYVNIGEKYIEIHKQPDLFVVNTNFEDIEFANAINNVTFAKKKNKIELNIKEAFKISSINKKIELSMLNTSIANLTNSQNSDSNENDESSVCDNKTLVINEETQRVYLPYTIEEVMKKLHNSSDYQSIQDVIEQEYTLPLSTFKMPIISRFKEAYRFMRVKEKSSVYAALDLAIELMFNSNLNPAIIRASKDLKELNIYLDCLYENELDKFDCFKIIYKVLPKIQ